MSGIDGDCRLTSLFFNPIHPTMTYTAKDLQKLTAAVSDLESNFKIYHELMPWKVRRILLVSTPYDAWILEEDGRLSERIINEYRGLNLSHPPQLTWVSTADDAMKALDAKRYDMVITMPRIADMNALDFAKAVKGKRPDIPVVLISHSTALDPGAMSVSGDARLIDRAYVWTGNTDLLVAVVKSEEDRRNAIVDTKLAGVRVILFVENSPLHTSTILPLLYKEVVGQTRKVLEAKLNEEHRLLVMRARPKFLVAETYEEAMKLFKAYEPYVLGVISDVEFPRGQTLDPNAGIDFLSEIRKNRFDIPLLLTSVEPTNKARAEALSAAFLDKTSPRMQDEIHSFFIHSLAFGSFVFRMPNGREVAKASDLRSLERGVQTVPAESLAFHAGRNDFSRWLFTRTEPILASKLRDLRLEDFESVEALRTFLVDLIHARRRARQRGIVVDFAADDFDLMTDFFKIGQGSLGGKARGLAFFLSLLNDNRDLVRKYAPVQLDVPQTLVITTEVFDEFIEANHLGYLAEEDLDDQDISARFMWGRFPKAVENDLRAYLSQVKYPLAVRSSSLLEDAQFQAYAGLYRTYMLPNESENLENRLEHLIHAIKQVYASIYFRGPKAFSRRISRRIEDERMAVIIQRLVGERYGQYYYPTISGVAQSHNYYPFARMQPEDGIATIALGLGRAVVEGERTLRFCPKFPNILPQRSSVADILENAQRFFYALKMGEDYHALDISESENLVRLDVNSVQDVPVVQYLSSTFVPAENRIRDTVMAQGHRVLTFANVLKYRQFPLPGILADVLAMGQAGMGTPVEMEFSVDLKLSKKEPPEFAFLQMRPMTARAELGPVDISEEEKQRARCTSQHALGNFVNREIRDIIFVRPEDFDVSKTVQIAAEISRMNARLIKEGRPYLLIGPGRWGTSDRWLGIPVRWADISGVEVMIEAVYGDFRVDPSQGSHFFHNITTQGIGYINISGNHGERIDWEWLKSLSVVDSDTFVSLVRISRPLTIKIDGSTHQCVMLDS
jgi:CheY-like chemotaxis protein